MSPGFRVPLPPRLGLVASLATAIAIPAAAYAIESFARPVAQTLPFALFFIAVAISSWLGGGRAGLLSTAVSAVLAYFFLRGSPLGPDATRAAAAAALFVPVGSVVVLVVSMTRFGLRERERAAEVVRESEARERARAEELEALMDAVPAMVLIAYDREAKKVWASREACDLLRLPSGANPSLTGERPPTHYRILKDGRPVEPAELPTQVAARTGRPARAVELQVVFDDGTERRILGNAAPLFDEAGRSRGAVSAFVDVTQLSDALRARDAFLSIASHELKTPLTSLQLQVQALLRTRHAEPVAKAAAAIERQVARLRTLVNALLDVSRLQDRSVRLDLEPVELSSVVRDVAGRFAADAERAGSPIEVEAADGILGRWDRLRVDQIVTNLLSNAIKYGAGRPISIRVDADPSNARIVVADLGGGVAPEEHGRIFERFERGRSARGYGGLGLGLWIARELATALGGRIEVRSEAGAGAAFRVVLPIEGPDQRPAALP
jgi:signal transduction histidine kinase